MPFRNPWVRILQGVGPGGFPPACSRRGCAPSPHHRNSTDFTGKYPECRWCGFSTWDALEKLSTALKLRLPPRPACMNNISKAHKKIRTFSPKLCTSWARRTKAPAPPTSFSKLELFQSPARCVHETKDFNIHTINFPASRTTLRRFELLTPSNLEKQA